MGITAEKVHAAADALLERGETPTLAAVRRELGRGSFTTISEAMRTWRARRGHDQVVAPSSVPAQLQDLAIQYAQVAVRAVWESAQEQVRAQMEADSQVLNEARAQVEAERREAVQLADSLSTELEQTQISLRAALEVQDGLRKELAEVRQKNADLRVQLEILTAQAEELRAERDRLLHDWLQTGKQLP